MADLSIKEVLAQHAQLHSAAADREHQDDFNRKVCSILGLPFDAVDMQAAYKKIYRAVDAKTPFYVSTPNLNFLIASQSDKDFRQSIINSDMSLADGMPLIWVAKLLRIPLKERVSGSGLFEAMMGDQTRAKQPVKAFFLGGMDGVAAQACERLNSNHDAGVICAGSLNPGFGSIEEMSQGHIIDTINRSGAEFVIVSLGARNGQAWIEHNRKRLDAPVISNLGAVVNFIAGTVTRAPRLWQRLGMEWLWRIKEEPALWRRYYSDGLVFLKLMITRVLPYALIIHFNKNKREANRSVSIKVEEKPGKTIIAIEGMVVEENLQPVRDAFAKIAQKPESIIIDLSQVEYADPFFIGLLLVLYKHLGDRQKITGCSPLVRRIFYYNSAGFLLK